MRLQPQNIEELQEMVRNYHRLLPTGGKTKPALSQHPDNDVNHVDMHQISGIIEYAPGEYTFTAYAGTTVKEIQLVLAEHNQYMPFDPLLVTAGATLGGTVAANTSDSGRYRYGGVRDFILGIQFVDGKSQLVKSGGKVVKNAAGFDLSKFMVGSLGRFGILTSISFKVFPQPIAYGTVQLPFPHLEGAVSAILSLAPRPFELDALDLELMPDSSVIMSIRMGSLKEALLNRLTQIQDFLKNHGQILAGDADSAFWAVHNAMEWAQDQPYLVKVPISPRQIIPFDNQLAEAKRFYTTGGNTSWIATNDPIKLDQILNNMNLSGLQIRGSTAHPYLGVRNGYPIIEGIKQALDPQNRFLEA